MAIVVSIVGKYDGRDIAKAQAELDRMGKQAGVTGGEMGGFGKSLVALGGVMAATFTVTKVVDFLKDSMTAAMEDEKAMRSLATAMENTGNAASIPKVEAGIDRLSRMAGVADDVLRPAFQTLVTSSGDVEQSQKALSLALDISTATGRDLNTVSLALARGYAGQTQGLSRLGAGLDKATLKTGDMDLITAALTKKFEGQAAAAAETYSGKMAKISVASSEASETIGYALLNAVDNASNSFGGTDGITARIDEFAASAADTITTISGLVGIITSLSSSVDEAAGKFSFAADSSDFLRDRLIAMIPGGQQLIDIFKTLGMLGDVWNGTQKQVSDVAPSATNQYVRMGIAAGVTATSIGELATETDLASDAQKRLAAAFGILDGAITRRQAINDLAVAIRGISKAADDGNVSLKGNSDAVIANQDVVIDAVRKAEAAAKAMGGTADEQAVNFGKGIARIRQSLVDNGFKPKDVDAFLKELKTADTKAALLLEGLGSGRAADAARYSAMALGSSITLGLIAGMNAGAGAVAGAGAKTIRELEAGARAAGEIQSPSQLFVRVGQDIVDGLVLGVADGSGKVAAAGASLIGSMSLQFDGAVVTMRGKGTELGGALADGYQARLDGFRGIVDTQVGIIKQGQDALKAYADTITSTIMGNVKFDTQNADGTPMTPEQIVASVFGSIENQNAAVAAVASNIGAKLPGDLLNMVLTMPPDAAIGVANYLGSNPALLEQLAWNYKGLGKFTNNALGVPMGEAWAMVGDESALSMIAKAKETISTEAASFRQWVRSNLATTITVKVEYDTSGAPSPKGKALGGPVTGGTPYIVGENGPELFVPGASGTIVPNDVLAGSASRGSGSNGNIYSITVNAGVGDPRMIGQQVVQYIKRFEQASGPVFASA